MTKFATAQQAAGAVLQALSGKAPYRVALGHLHPGLGAEWPNPITEQAAYSRALDIANGMNAAMDYCRDARQQKLILKLQQIAVALAQMSEMDDDMLAASIEGVGEDLEEMFELDPNLRPTVSATYPR